MLVKPALATLFLMSMLEVVASSVGEAVPQDGATAEKLASQGDTAASNGVEVLPTTNDEFQDHTISTPASVMRRHRILSGRFQQSQSIEGVSDALVSYGSFLFVRDSALVWTTQSPLQSELVLSVKGDGKSRVERRMSKVLLDVFSADILSDPNFAVEQIETQTGWQVEIVPKRQALARHVKKIVLSGSEFVSRTSLELGHGTSSVMEFSEVEVLADIPVEICVRLSSVCENP